MIPDIAAKSGIFASDIPILNGSKRANEHFSGTFWQRDTGTLLARIVGCANMQVNSSHHQAVLSPGRGLINARAPDGVIEGIEDSSYRFFLGVQWRPEYFIDPGDRRIFDALVAACAA